MFLTTPIGNIAKFTLDKLAIEIESVLKQLTNEEIIELD